MKISQSITTKLVFTLALLIGVSMFAISVAAQKSLAPTAIGINIEQCANGPLSAPIPCNISSGSDGYSRGNVNEQKAHYVEGQSVPIRFIADGLTIGQQYTVTIGYDYTKAGKYATDYLTDYDRTESVNNDPCVGVTGCVLSSETTFPIPADPGVAAGFDQIPGNADDIIQIAGSFSCFGCTITGVSGYTLTGSTAGDSSKSLTITFTANQSTIVIAYGSHISRRFDWGISNSAISISGSPYHNFVVDFPGANGGSRDLQLSATAVIFPGAVTIIKLVENNDNTYHSVFAFGFTASANYGTTAFSLIDSNPAQFVGASNTNSNIQLFGSANTITVTENTPPSNYGLLSLVCVEDSGGLPQLDNSTTNLGTRTASIIVEEGEFVTCTFTNSQLGPTAAMVSISGRVLTSEGMAIAKARVVMTDQSGVARMATTNSFGYYRFDDVEAGQTYVFNVVSKQYQFDPRVVTLEDELSNLDFIAF